MRYTSLEKNVFYHPGKFQLCIVPTVVRRAMEKTVLKMLNILFNLVSCGMVWSDPGQNKSIVILGI